MLAAVQITAPTTTTSRTTKQALSAARLVLRCHGVGYAFMSCFERGPDLDACHAAAERGRVEGSALGIARAHYVGLLFGKSLLIRFFVPSTFSARFLFSGSSVSAFSHASSASGMRFNFKELLPMCSDTTGSSCCPVFAARSR